MHEGEGVCGGQRCQASLELELQVIMDYLTWMLRSEFRSSVRAVTTESSLQPWFSSFLHTS